MQVVQESEHISTRLTQNEIREIDKLVEEGLFLNRSDFLRTAARAMLSNMEIINLRDISIDEAKREILEYLKRKDIAYPSDIADELKLDLKTTVQAIKELWQEGKIEEV